jgi:hypothetical protein
MSPRTRRAALVCITYWAAAATARVLWSGRMTPTTESFALLVAVPSVQIALVECAIAVRRRTAPTRRLSRLAMFFGLWLLLALALIPASIGMAVGVFRNIDLTGGSLFSTVFIPPLQALVLVLPFDGQRRWARVCADVVAHPLARPILWIDAVMLTAGLALLQNPEIGVARLAPMQRHWTGTKFIAAALFFVLHVRLARSDGDRWPRPAALAGLAAALAAVGLHAFTPWILTAADYVPRPISDQPLPLLWLEMYSAIFAAVLVSVLTSAPALERSSPTAARLAEAATLLLFFATLAVLTNGALSLQPVAPWAQMALLTASLSATLFAWAAILGRVDS